MTEDALSPGTVLGSYRVERLLGKGGMGAVYVATHLGLDKKVALKTLHTELAKNADVVERFLREGRAASRIRHPHVVDVSDVGAFNGMPYLVMELLDGEDLATVLDRDGTLEPARAIHFVLPVLAAVGAAHDAGVVHRDLKPENIFLAKQRDRGVQPKVVDFGISKLVDDSEQRARTGTGALLGTPYYMAPEQARGTRDVDARADQYAIGAILYECLSGRLPVEGDTFYALLHAIVAGAIAPLSRPDLPPELVAVVHKALATKREDRFPDVRALARALLPFATSADRAQWEAAFGAPDAATLVSVAAPTAPAAPTPSDSMMATRAATLDPRESLSPRPPLRAKRSWVAVAVAGGIAALALGAAGIGLWMGGGSQQRATAAPQRRAPLALPSTSVHAPTPPAVIPSVPTQLATPTPPPAAVDAGVDAEARVGAQRPAGHGGHPRHEPAAVPSGSGDYEVE